MYIVTGKVSDSQITVASAITATDGASDLNITPITNTRCCDAFVDWPSFSEGGYLQFETWGVLDGSSASLVSVTGATWTEATRTLTKTGGFTNYANWGPGDRITITGGPFVQPGVYMVSSRTSNDAIVLTTSIGGLASTAITNATWTNGTLTMTKVGAFANYTWTSGDKISVTGGTGATVAVYTIASKVSSDAITLTATIGAPADGSTDIAFTTLVEALVHDVQEVRVRLWAATDDEKTITNLVQNSTGYLPFLVGPSNGTNGNFALSVRLRLNSPAAGDTAVNTGTIDADLVHQPSSTNAAGFNSMHKTSLCTRMNGSADLKKPLNYYMSMQKVTSTAVFDMVPRGYMVTHVAPRIS
jgi:hypothetical protein